ncbi:MAG: hypothetical protein NTV34_09915 [Proteobacteria bacterium]|nr:hypothetical protein [Pseudomonadota bacterium]
MRRIYRVVSLSSLIVIIASSACRDRSANTSAVKDYTRSAGEYGENSMIFKDPDDNGKTTMFFVQCPDNAPLAKDCGGAVAAVDIIPVLHFFLVDDLAC